MGIGEIAFVWSGCREKCNKDLKYIMRGITFAAFLAVVAGCSAVSFFSVALEEFEAFKLEHGKKYDSDVEEQFRMKIYMENKHKIAKHNLLFHSRPQQKKYHLKMNKYGD